MSLSENSRTNPISPRVFKEYQLGYSLPFPLAYFSLIH
jgi:hypothetical protein